MDEALIWTDVSNIFIPNDPIDSAEWLVGRRDTLRSLLQHFANVGAIPVVYGTPGIGKTSVLRVLSTMLVGFDDTATELGLDSYSPPATNRLVLSIECGPSDTSIESLAARVLKELRADGAADDRSLHLKDVTLTAKVPVIEAAVKFARETKVIKETSETEALRQWISDSTVGFDGEVVVLLDECDLLPCLESLLDLVRDLRSYARFILAMRDYALPRLRASPYGDHRWLVDIRVERLNNSDIEELFGAAVARLATHGLTFDLSDRTLREIQKRSGGEPWYLQMVGFELLKLVFNSKEPENFGKILPHHLDQAEESGVRSRLMTTWVLYYKSILTRRQRCAELIQHLSVFSESKIPEDYVRYIGRARHYRSVDLARRLAAEAGGPLIRHEIPVPSYEFRSHEFRVYCRVARDDHQLTRDVGRELELEWRDLQT